MIRPNQIFLVFIKKILQKEVILKRIGMLINISLVQIALKYNIKAIFMQKI